MTFKKNLFTLLAAVFLAVTGAWLVGIGTAEIVSGLTLVIPTVVMALLIEDLFRKLLGAREKLTWQYFLGEVFVIASVLMFLYASKSITVKEMAIRLIATFLLGVCGILWFNVLYKRSIESDEERLQETWAKYRAKVRAAGATEGYKVLACTLRYHLVGDTLDGALDFDKPLAEYGEQLMTLEELIGATDDGSGIQQIAVDEATNYIKKLVANLG
jgi:hypothetical protein